MSKFIGRQQEIGLGRETSRGTVVTPSFWVPKSNFKIEDKALKAKFNGSYGVLPGGDDALVTQKWSEGDLEMNLTDKTIGLLMYALFGTSTPASFNSVYKHTMSIQNSVQPTTLSLVMHDPIGSVDLAYAMAMVNSFEIEVALGELVAIKVNFIGKSHKDVTPVARTYTAENKFAHNHLTFKVAANSASLSAASKINLQSFKMKIERMVVRENALGTVQPVDVLARGFKISGSLKLTYEDRTYRDYMMNGTKKAIRMDLVNTDVTIGSTNPAFRIDLPICHFEQWEPGHPLEEIAMQDINFEALYDVANSYLISDAYVVNSTSSY